MNPVILGTALVRAAAPAAAAGGITISAPVLLTGAVALVLVGGLCTYMGGAKNVNVNRDGMNMNR